MARLKRKSDSDLLASIDSKIDIITTTLAVTCEKVATHEKDINGNGTGGLKRDVKALEEGMWRAKGWAAALGTMAGGVISMIVAYFKHGK